MARIPASVNKLYTTSAALLLYGADGQLTTEVLGAGADRGRRPEGDLYLRGGGDPSFSRARRAGSPACSPAAACCASPAA